MQFRGINKSNAILLLAAFIWGLAFVAQRAGMEYIGPFTFNGIRFALGGFTLLPFANLIKNKSQNQLVSTRILWLGGLFSGLILFTGASLQQTGIIYTTAGNAGFITSLYVIIVPVLGLFWKHKINLQTWMGVILATCGLYFLSVTRNFSFSCGDMIVLISAFFFALHVLVIGWFSPRTDAIKFSIIQFMVCAVLSLFTAVMTEEIKLSAIRHAAIPILYGGIMSVGVGYTLQVIGQKKAIPSHAAIILSLESLFALAGGWIILNEGLTLRGIFGCFLMLSGIIITQIKNNVQS